MNTLLERIAQFANSRPWLVLSTIFVLGLVLRVYAALASQGYHYFSINDELSAWEYALAWMAGEPRASYLGQPAFAGGQIPGPLWTLYTVMLLKLGGGDPSAAVVWSAVFSSLCILMAFKLAEGWLQRHHALLVAAMVAFMPWPVYYALGLWNPVPMILLGGMLFMVLWNVVNNQGSRTVFWVPFLLAAMIQFHMITVFYIPAILLVIWAAGARIRWRWFVYGVFAGLALYIPYVLGEIEGGWSNLKNILDGGGDAGFSPSVIKIITVPVSMLSIVPGRWAGETTSEMIDFGNAVFLHYWVLIILSIWSLLLGLIWFGAFVGGAFERLRNRKWSLQGWFGRDPGRVFVAILLLVPLLLFILTGKNYASRYSIIIFSLLYSIPVFFLWNRRGKRRHWHWFVQMLVLMLAGLYMQVSFFAWQGKRIDSGNQFMPSFSVLQSIYLSLREDAGNDVRIRILLPKEKDDGSLEQKLLAVVSDYVNVYQKYIENPEPTAPLKNYEISYCSDSATALVVRGVCFDRASDSQATVPRRQEQ